jgi:hypothetical protein
MEEERIPKKVEFSAQILKNAQVSNFMKIFAAGA